MDNTLLKIEPSAPTESDWHLEDVTLEDWVKLWAAFARIETGHARTAEQTCFVDFKVTDAAAELRYATGYQLIHHDKRLVEQTADVIAIDRLIDGFAAMDFDECNYVHRPGYVVISDYAQPFRGSQHRAVGETLMVSRRQLGLSGLKPFSPVVLSESSFWGNVLVREMQRFRNIGEDDERNFADDLSTTLTSIFREHASPVSDRDEWWQSRRKLIRKFIETHLDDPNLGPLQICNLFNMSRATLYRMFEADGGVRRFIQDRRLFSAMWDLALGGIRRGRLSRVAEQWGFSSDANFNRAAKLAYGMPPGAFFKRDQAAAGLSRPYGALDHPFCDWLAQRYTLI